MVPLLACRNLSTHTLCADSAGAPPTYLAIPPAFTLAERGRPVPPSAAARLAALARAALDGRTARAAIRWFELHARAEATR